MKDIRRLEILIPDEEMLGLFKSHSFNIKKDLKQIKLTDEKLLKLIEEQCLDEKELLKGDVLCGNSNHVSIKKIYFNYNNVGKKRGLRVISLIIVTENLAILFHLYNKSEKKKLSSQETKSLKAILKEFQS